MLDKAWLVLVRRHLPEFFQPDAEFLRVAALIEAVARHKRLGEVPARAFREQRVLGAQFHAAGERILGGTVLADPHVAGGDPDHLAIVPIEDLARRKSGIDLDPEGLRLGGEPFADLAQRHDVGAVIAHQRRHHEIGQRQRPTGREHVEAVALDRGLDGGVLGAPVRQQAVKPDRVDHRAGQDVGADLGTLFHHHHREVGGKLLEPDGGGKPAGPGPDHHDIEFHRLAGG